jgi:hypothetical protein
MSTVSRNDLTIKSRLGIQSKTFMFTIIWNPSGFYVVDGFPNDTKMNTAYFVTNMFAPVDHAIFPRGREPSQKQLVIDLDNFSVHTSRASRDWVGEHDM